MNIIALSYGENYIYDTSDIVKSTNKGKKPLSIYDENENRSRYTRLIPYHDSPVKNSYLYPNIKLSMKPYTEKLVNKSVIYNSIKQTKRETTNNLPELKHFWY